jgi:hypothetical protein
MAFEDFFDHATCDVCLKTIASQDATGAPARDPYTVVATAVPVLLRPQGGSLEQRNDKRSQVRIARLYIDPVNLPTGFRLSVKHQLRVPNVAGRVFVVKAVSDPNTLGHHLEIDCEEQPH